MAVKSKKDLKYSKLAVTGFVLSLLFFIPILPLVGFILGIIALVKIAKNKDRKGKGLAIAAIVIGLVVTLLQMVVVFLIYTLIMSFFHFNIPAGTPQEQINYCVNSTASVQKDLCIFNVVSMNMNQLSSIDSSVCDKEVSTPDLKQLCNALLKNDPSYCDNISSSEAKLKCQQIFVGSSKNNTQ